MRVIVSCDDLNLQDYTVVQSYKELLNWKASDIECIILHSSVEDDANTVLNLSSLQTHGVKTVAYISKSPSQIIKCCIQAIGGICVEDDFYLEDVEELNYLVEQINLSDEENTKVDTIDTSVVVISDFLKAFINHDARLDTPIYLDTVNRAVQNISEQNQLVSKQVKQVGESAIDIFSNLSETLNTMRDSSNIAKKKLDELESQLTQHASQAKFGFQQVFLFPPVNYFGVATVLSICEVSPCRFLTSFLLAYREYLHTKFNKRAKFILLHQKNRRSSMKYKDKFTYIGTETMHKDALLKEPVIVTDTPKEEIMKLLLHQNDEVIIVLDRMYNDPIMKGKVKTLYAINGESDINRFKLKPTSVIASDNPNQQLFMSIPYIESFDTSGSSSLSCYYNMCRDLFNKLNKFLELEED